MGGQTTQVGAVYPSYMDPMRSTGYMYNMGAMMDDIYARQLYTSLNNQIPNYGGQQYTDAYQAYINANANNTQNFGATQTGQKKGFGRSLLTGLGVGGAAYAGMQFPNHRFNSPIETLEGGGVQFNERFMNHFAGEYAAVENGSELTKFYNSIGNGGVKAENIEQVFNDLKIATTPEGFKEIADLADKNPALKEVLQKGGILDSSGNMASTATIEKVQELYTKNRLEFRNINANNNIIKQSQMLERAKGLEEGWKACGKNLGAKRLFLVNNADVLGIAHTDVQKLLFDSKLDAAALDGMYTAGSAGIDGFKAACTTNIDNIKTSMKSLAETSWNKDAGFFAKKGELFKGKYAKELTNALTKARRSRSLWVAGIAAVATIIISSSARKKA